MIALRRSIAVVVASMLGGCVLPRQHGGAGEQDLRKGMWVEAKGPVAASGPPVVTEVEQIQREPSHTSDKVEIRAPVEAASKDRIRITGVPVRVVEKTGFENAERQEVERFALRAGDWVKVKARLKEDGLRARTVRRSEPRDRFEVEGEILDSNLGDRSLVVGGVPLRLADDLKVDLLGEHQDVSPDDPLALFLADEQKGVAFTIKLLPTLRAGGELAIKGQYDDEFDLDGTRPKDRGSLRVEGKLDLLWRFAESGSFALVEATAGRRYRFRQNDVRSVDDAGALSRAYAYFLVTEDLRIVAGRQDFVEEREWLYDEVLDGVRATWRLGDVELEGGAAVGREILDDTNETQSTMTFTGLVRAYLSEKHWVTGYVLQRKDASLDNFEPFLMGLRSYSKPWRGLGHWLEASYASGFHGRRLIDGYALDAGLMYRFGGSLRPTLAAGYAMGSGRAGGRIGFRQSGLQDNNAKFGGVTRFRYYGEVLEPELANLHVATVGFGIRPVPELSFDAVAHWYRQDVAAPSLLSRLRATPNGRSRDLGWGADLIVGFRLANRMTAELVAGRFEPGPGFDGADPAKKLEMTLRVKF